MSAVLGTLYSIFPVTGTISTAAAATDKMFSMQNVTMNLDQDLPDVTTMDSAGWAEFLAGIKSFNMSFSGVWDEANSATMVTASEIVAAIIAGNTAKKFCFVPAALGTSIPGWKGMGFYKNVQISADNGQGVKVSGSIQGTGALVLFDS